MTIRASWGVAIVVLALAACGEKPQTVSASKLDVRAFEGAGTAGTAYTAAGWKAGDHASWERQMVMRAQGQNEYSRVSAQ